MSAPSTLVPPQQLIAAAKAATIAYNNKDWAALRAAVTPDFIYDEVGTQRKVQGVEQAITLFQGWAAAFPDSRGTFGAAIASGNTVALEVTWEGTHQGTLQTPDGTVAPTGKRFEIRACLVMELTGEKVSLQRQYFDMATLLRQLGA
ncbi:MAG: ester cyclase [Gemmatimonadales bacterium]